jgi:hypothetical protein
MSIAKDNDLFRSTMIRTPNQKQRHSPQQKLLGSAQRHWD